MWEAMDVDLQARTTVRRLFYRLALVGWPLVPLPHHWMMRPQWSMKVGKGVAGKRGGGGI